MRLASPALLLPALLLLPACSGTRAAEAPESAELRAYAMDWERILAAEDGRAGTDEELRVLTDALRHDAPALRRIAVRGLGRLERPALAGAISPLLRDPDAGVRAHAANALAQASRGGPIDQAPLEQALASETDPRVAGIIAESIGRTRQPGASAAAEAAERIVGQLEVARSDAERLGTIRGLFFLARQQGTREAFGERALAALRTAATGSGGESGEEGTRVRVVALATLATLGVGDERLVEAAQGDAAWPVRREAVLVAGSIEDDGAARRRLAAALKDEAAQVRLEALRVLGRRTGPAEICGPARAGLTDPDDHVRAIAIELLGTCTAPTPDDLARLESSASGYAGDDWHEPVRALAVLAARDPAIARARLAAGGYPTDPFARAHVARVVGILGDVDGLRTLASDQDLNVRTAAVRELVTLAGRAADEVYLAQLRLDDSQLLQAAAAALEGSSEPAAATALLDALDRVSAARSETSRDARRALLRRAGELGGPEHEARVRPYLADFDPVIAELAAEVLERWTGARPEPAATAPQRLALPDFEEASRLAASRIDIEMADGARVVLRLLPFEAPTNAARFARLASRGYFDGLTFHRVVPNFVVQGGSPHANEYTGDGPFTRDELGLVGNWRGSVGLSTRGRDTGDGQIFFNLVDNVRLDHDYTIFALVEEGMDAVDRMREGARIRTVRVRYP